MWYFRIRLLRNFSILSFTPSDLFHLKDFSKTLVFFWRAKFNSRVFSYYAKQH